MGDGAQRERFEREVLPHLDAAYNLARWLLQDPHAAEDATQEACLRALRYLDGFRGGNARAWLLTIVRNVCHTRGWHRRESLHADPARESTGQADAQGAPSAEGYAAGVRPVETPEEALQRQHQRDRVDAALAGLSTDLREVVVLRDLEGLSYREISEVVGIPLGTVMSRLARGRGRLREILIAHGKAREEP